MRLISHATSLGGVESLIERRGRYEIDAGFGTPPTLLRFSVGIEHVEDLWDDLARPWLTVRASSPQPSPADGVAAGRTYRTDGARRSG